MPTKAKKQPNGKGPPGVALDVPALELRDVNVTTDEGRTYAGVATVMNDSELRKQAINKLKSEANALRRRLVLYEEFADVCESIEALEAAGVAA